MDLKQVYSLPRDEAGYGNIRITADSVNLSVEFEHWEGGQNKLGLIKFLDLSAFRFYDEMQSDFEGDLSDTIYEVVDSPWRKQLLATEPENIHGVKDKHHFTVFLSNNGCLEVIAERLEVAQSEDGVRSHIPTSTSAR